MNKKLISPDIKIKSTPNRHDFIYTHVQNICQVGKRRKKMTNITRTSPFIYTVLYEITTVKITICIHPVLR